MKRIRISLIALGLVLSTTLSAQEDHVFDIRLHGGFNVLQLSSDNTTSLIDGVVHERSVSGRPGIQFGGAVTFGTRFYVQPGFHYTTIGTTIRNESTVDNTSFEDETKIMIASVPLRVGFRMINPHTENLFNVRVFGGFDGHHVVGVEHSKNSDSFDQITKDDYNPLMMNADFGMGLDLWIFYADLGYQIGLTPVHSNGDNAKASAFYGNIGLRFTFGE